MKESKKYRFYRRTLISTAFIMLAENFAPTLSWALTSGPSQPEFSSFEPVATTNMVNDFTGDFTYNLPVVNIPGANGGGYALSLSYHSGASPEEDASWVGYGWTLNPGAISRNKKGLPDDYNGTKVKYWNKARANKTVTVGVSVNVEGWSIDAPINLNGSLRYNNYKGFGYMAGAGFQLAKGLVSLGFSISDGQGSFSARVNPAALLSHTKPPDFDNKTFKNMDSQQREKNVQKRKDATNQGDHRGGGAFSGAGVLSLAGSNYGIVSHSEIVRNDAVTRYKAESYNFTASVLAAITPLQVGPTFDVQGSFSKQENVNSNGDAGVADLIPVYGYMYTDKAPANSNSMMDYYMEKLTPYDKQDKYLGIPFTNADNFSLSGEGLGGGFRMYNKNAGTFHPNSIASKTKIFNIGAEVEAGLNIGGGGDVGVGFQKLMINDWEDAIVNGHKFTDSASTDEPYFFRFSNDQGGSVEFGNDDSPHNAQLQITCGVPGLKRFTAALPSSDFTTVMNSGNRSGRSSYISYHTNRQMGYVENGKQYKSYTLSNDINSMLDRTKVPDGVGEVSVFNEDGMRYVYGLPVYSRNELEMNYDLQGINTVDSNYLAYRNISNLSALNTINGEERQDPYATSYLLTEITSPDYVDRKMDGPSDDDFGGFTRFSYNRICGSNDKTAYADTNWYKWRIPYTGLHYNPGERSSQLDDMGSVSYGEKEIYYMDTIMTKTHFAVFRVSNRDDGYSSKDNNTAASTKTAKGTKRLKKLDRIDIYSKNNGSPKLIKSVRFEYDYSLCVGVSNALNSSTGKLTLKRVWFEYDGVANAKISPYVFGYTYPTTTYPTKYSSLQNYGNGKVENPRYSPFDIDAWNNYQYKGHLRFDSLRTSVNQNPKAAFDPAAWQLKVIQLPSGGEIHVQYEQKDYAFVQDKSVQAMVSLKSSGSNDVTNKYYLNVRDLGLLESSSSDMSALRGMINDQYVLPKKKMYFKFLYKLLGLPTTDIHHCNIDYISGYCNVKQVGKDGGGLFVILGPESGSGKYDVPSKVCRDFVKTQRMGNMDLSGNCDPSANGISTAGTPKEIVESLIGFLATNLAPGDAELCASVNFPMSFLKVPMTKAKLGGGVRVKRIMMYDKGVESGDVSLFGSEYVYQNADGTSSGVTTNEPASIREENAVVEFDAKYKQTFLNKVVAGRDREHLEKPLGESILPGPSIGYARVVTKNIFTGTTAPGFAVKEYNTCKQFPMQAYSMDIDTKHDFLPIPGGLINIFINNLWTTQGFSFVMNNMHGQPLSESTYRGDPADPSNASLSSQQVYTYFAPGEKIPVMNSLNNITWQNPGKEMELTMESRGVEDYSHDIAGEWDADVGIAFIPIPFASGWPSYTYTESRLYTHTNSKIVQYPAIVKSVQSYADGIYHLSENVAFNPLTGKPVLTRTYDGYHALNLQQSANHSGRYYKYDFPAAQQYNSMSQRSKNETAILISNTLTVEIEKKLASGTKYYLEFTAATGYSICDAMGKLSPGDLIKIKSTTGADLGIYHVQDSIVGNNLFLYNTAAYGLNTNVTSHPTGVVIEVLRSGRTNQLSTMAGSFTSYGDTAKIQSNWDPNEIADRTLLAARLDSLVQLGAGSHDLPPALIPSGLYFLSSPCSTSPTCVRLKDSVGVTGLNVNVSAGVGVYFSVPAHLPCLGCFGLAGCCSSFPSTGSPGHFGIDPDTKDLVYYYPGNMCYPEPLKCLRFCPYAVNTTKVVVASAQTFNSKWPYDTTIYSQVVGSDPYENGTKGKWRTEASYVYKDTIIGANYAPQRNYADAGVFKLKIFDWKNPPTLVQADTLNWVKLSTVTAYSPDGNALEEKDILGIYSAAKFGYDGTQPYLVAKNSDYGSVQFDGFERKYSSGKFEDGWKPASSYTWDTVNTAHSGKASLKIAGNGSLDLKPFNVTNQILNNGIQIKAWVRDTAHSPAVSIKGRLVRTSPSSCTVNLTFKKVARVGEWILYEANEKIFSGCTLSVGQTLTPYIDNNYTSKSIWLDDIRVQPSDAQVVAYVYDIKTLRLVAQFDDQHFGMLYQYNAEGKLVRKIVETEKGVKTITETEYHTPLQAR